MIKTLFSTRVYLLGALLAFGSTTILSAQDAAAQKKADIDKLLEVTGAMKVGQQMATTMVTQMSKMIKESHPDVPQDLLDSIPEDVGAVIKEHFGEFKAPMVALYDKYYTADDIKQLLAFYSSDIGKKIISVTPSLMQESVGVGMKWGQSLGPEIEQRIQDHFKKRGITL